MAIEQVKQTGDDGIYRPERWVVRSGEGDRHVIRNEYGYKMAIVAMDVPPGLRGETARKIAALPCFMDLLVAASASEDLALRQKAEEIRVLLYGPPAVSDQDLADRIG